MTKKGISLALIILAVAIAAGAIASYMAARGPSAPSASPSQGTTTPSSAIDTTDWKTYTSRTFGFSFKYPPSWQNSGDPLTAVNPHIFFGNPLSGTTTYRLNVFVYANPGDRSSEDYVNTMIASDTAEDVRSGAASGTAPRLAPQFARAFALTVGGVPAYELYGVFEYDHQGEQIYVANGLHVIVFDFPTADANPNLADPAANNAVAHAIVDSLTFRLLPVD